MSLNLREIFHKTYYKDYFHRNNKIFMLSIIIFIVLGSIGTISNSDTMGIQLDKNFDDVQSAANSESKYDTSLEGFLQIFINNIINDYTSIFGGLLLLIPTLYLAFINGTNFITLLVYGNPLIIVVGVLPHGIFEIPSSIFALAGGLMLFITEINVIKAIITRNSVREALNNSNTLIKDAILTTIIVFILLLIAAFIETFITTMLLSML